VRLEFFALPAYRSPSIQRTYDCRSASPTSDFLWREHPRTDIHGTAREEFDILEIEKFKTPLIDARIEKLK
jgi:hypothetical protein